MSPDQWAQREAERYISAQIAAIEAERKAYLDELANQSKIEAERGMALAQALQSMGFPTRIQGLYSQAAGDMAGLAGGFSEGLRGQAEAQAAEQANMLSGTGQEGAVRNEGVGMSDVNYGLHGFIPGRSMTETGAAFGAQAALEPSFAARIGQLEAGRVHSEGMKGLSDFAKAIAEIKAQKPGMVQDLLDKRRDRVFEQQEWSLKRLESERDWYLQQAALADRMGDSRRAEEYLRLARQREQRMIMQSQGLDMNGNPLPGYRWKNGQIVKVPKPSSKSSSKGPDWGDIQKDIAEDVPSLVEKKVDPNRPWAGEVEVPMSYQKAYNVLWQRYSGLVKDKARLKALIRKILIANGIKPKPKPGSPNLAPGTHSGDR